MTRATPATEAPSTLVAAAGTGRAPDAESMAWVTALSSAGAARQDARARLRALLLRAARRELLRRGRAPVSHPGADLDDLAAAAADDALAAIERELDTYRGTSRFTTWAAKFALYEAGVAFHERAWSSRPVPPEADGFAQLDDDIAAGAGVEAGALLIAVRGVLAERLTERERFVVVSLVLNGVPIDVLAQRLGTTRGALYETLHDARRKIRDALAQSSPAG
jgi:RNA polymerase sigma-70 factor (ECF subfamily)